MKRRLQQIIRAASLTVSWYASPVGLVSAAAIVAVAVLAIVGASDAAILVLVAWLAVLLPYKLQRERADRAGQSSRLSKRVGRVEQSVNAVRSDLALTPTVDDLVVWQADVDRRIAQAHASLARLDQVREMLRQQRDADHVRLEHHLAVMARADEDLQTLAESVDAIRDELASGQAHVESALAADVASLRDQIERQLPARVGAIERRSQSDVAALVALHHVLDVGDRLPSFASWALSPAAALAVVEAIVEVNADLVVEAGSGSSTVVAALAMAKQGHGRVIALEHDLAFAEKTRRELRRLGVENHAEVVVAPLVEHVAHGDTYLWYALDDVVIDRPIDVLLVDGPPGTTGPSARYPAVPILAQHLSPDVVVFLDDVDRDDERNIASRWSDQFGFGFSMGLADGHLARGQMQRPPS